MKRYKVDDVYCPYECSFGCTQCKLILGIFRAGKFDYVLIEHKHGFLYKVDMEQEWGGKFEKSMLLQPDVKVYWKKSSKGEFKVVFTDEENDNVDNIIKQINRELNDNSSL